MTLLSTTTTATIRAKGAKDAARHPRLITKGAKAAVGVKAAQTARKHPGVITKGAKAAVGVKAAQTARKHPGIIRVSLKAGMPVARRKVGKDIGRIKRYGESAREVGETVLVCSALVAEGLGLVDRPKPRPTAALVATGVVIGASAVYFFEPGHGRERRDKLLKLAA